MSQTDRIKGVLHIKQLVAAQPGLTYLDYDATYSADEDVNIVIRLSSGDTSAGYWITFK